MIGQGNLRAEGEFADKVRSLPCVISVERLPEYEENQYMVYYNSLDRRNFKVAEPSIQLPLYMMKRVIELVEHVDEKKYNEYVPRFEQQWQKFVSKGGGIQ